MIQYSENSRNNFIQYKIIRMMLNLNNNKGLVSEFEYITLACSKFPAQNVPVKMKVKVGDCYLFPCADFERFFPLDYNLHRNCLEV